MVQTFDILNYKGIDHLNVEGIAPFTLLTGRNNVRKSTVLEALFTFFLRNRLEQLLYGNIIRGIALDPSSFITLLSPMFYNFDVRKPFEFRLKDGLDTELLTFVVGDSDEGPITIDKLSEFRTTTPSPTLSALNIAYKKNDEPALEAQIVSNDGHLSSLGQTLPLAHGVTLNLPTMRHDAKDMAERLGKILIQGNDHNLIKSLQIIEPGLSSLATIPVGDKVAVYGDVVGLSHKIQIGVMGDGVYRLLSILLHIATSRLVLIDEIDAGFHYSVLSKVFQAAAIASEVYNCQVVATTHSYEALQAAHEGIPKDQDKDFAYFRIGKTTAGLEAHRFSFNEFSHALDADLEIR